MTKIKLCGLTRVCDIEAANRLLPEYIGFVFWEKSKRYISPEKAMELKMQLSPDIKAVGVFVNEAPKWIVELINQGILDMIQLHGNEDEEYIHKLRALTDRPIIKAFQIVSKDAVRMAGESTADYVLLDSGAGTGSMFDWSLIKDINRPYFLAGGLSPDNVSAAIESLHPYAVDVSSGIEKGGVKDKTKMAALVASVRKGRIYTRNQLKNE